MNTDPRHPPHALPIIEHLARCGLVFMEGAPPDEYEHPLLAYTGGCNAIIAMWSDRKRRFVSQTAAGEEDDDPLDIHCWMVLPHPSIWPQVAAPAELLPERSLYNERAGDVFTFLPAVPDDGLGQLLSAARQEIAAQRHLILEAHCCLDKDGTPRRDTLDAEVQPELARIEQLLAGLDRALEGRP